MLPDFIMFRLHFVFHVVSFSGSSETLRIVETVWKEKQ